MKIEIPLRRVVTTQFNEAFTALCRAKGLDIKLCFPLARMKRANEAATKKFVEDRDLASESHGSKTDGVFKFTDASHEKLFAQEVNALLDAPVVHELPCKVKLADNALTPDLIAELLELLDE